MDGLYSPSKVLSQEYREVMSERKTWSQYKKLYSLTNISDDMINRQQREQLENFNFQDNGIVSNINDELKNKINPNFSEAVEEKVVNNIEKNFQGLKERFKQAEENKGFSFEMELSNLIGQYEEIIKKISSLQQSNTFVDYNKLDSIGKSMYKLQNEINLLKAWIQNDKIAKNYDEFIKLRVAGIKTENAHFIKQKRKNSVSLIRSLAGIGSALKGAQLELLATEKLASIILDDEKKENQAVINTGSIKISIGQGAINIKEDISLFDITSDLQVILINGEKISIKELVERCKKNYPIILKDNNEYEKLQQAMILAVSAKSTNKKNMINLHSGLTVSNILNENISQDAGYWSLYHLWQLKQWNDGLRDNFSYRKNLINYNMSKMLGKIIGKKNLFMVTKEGFISTYDYISELLTQSEYIKVNKPSLNKAMSVQMKHL